jgi:hypothetical protein
MQTKDVITGASTTRARTRGTAPSGRFPGGPLEVLIEHLESHPRVDAGMLLMIDRERSGILPAASWFASPVLGKLMGPFMARPYDLGLPGFTETALQRERPLFLPRLEDWEGAAGVHGLLETRMGGGDAEEVWLALSRASVIACAVRTALGEAIGVLVVLSLDPGRPLLAGDLLTITALADMAALALDRAQLLAAEADRSREELLLKRAGEDASGSLDTAHVLQHVADHARLLVDAGHSRVSRPDPGTGALVEVSSSGELPADPDALDPGSLAAVARAGLPQMGTGDFQTLHVPVGLGPRVVGVISVLRASPPPFSGHDAELLQRLARVSAAAVANAMAFERERRVARALTRSFVPESLPERAGHDVGLVYEPSAHQPAGGDVYGMWTLPGGELCVLVGDVAGKGVETAALSAMTRFFVEARSWDMQGPAEVLSQANTMLRSRLPEDTFVTAFLAVVCDRGVVYSSAGHLPPFLVRAGGNTAELLPGGMPLGVDADPGYAENQLDMATGDLLFAYTDGLVEARRGIELFGEPRLMDAVIDSAAVGSNAQDLVRRVHETVRDWAGGLNDDTVALALRRA